MIKEFNKTDSLAAKLQIPYLLWVTFAGYLNFMIWILNRERVTEDIDYVEAQMDVLDTGIALVEENIETKEDFSELKSQGMEKKSKDLGGGQASTTNTQLNQNAQSTNVLSESEQLWFYSINGSDSINKLFVQALGELKYKQWETAGRMFDSIISMEINNPGAYLGKVMARYGIASIDELYTSSNSRFEKDLDLQRAVDYGNTEQKNFISELRKEREQKWKFDKAMFQKRNARYSTEYILAARLFDELGDYSTAKSQAENCRILAEDARERARQEEEEQKIQKEIDELVDKLNNYTDVDMLEECYRQLESLNDGAIVGKKLVSDAELDKYKERIQRVRRENKVDSVKSIIKFILLAVLAFLLYNYLYIYNGSENVFMSYVISTGVVVPIVWISWIHFEWEDSLLLVWVYRFMFTVMPILLLIRRYIVMAEYF